MQRFLERIVEHLERVQRVGHEVAKAGLVPDLARYQAFAAELFEHATGPGPHHWRWDRPYLATFLEELSWELLDGAGRHWSPDELADFIKVAIAEHSGLTGEPMLPALSPVRAGLVTAMVDSVVRRMRFDDGLQAAMGWQVTPRYCEHLGLTRHRAEGTIVAAAGTTLLGLRGADRLRWLLAVETWVATSSLDPWCVDLASVRSIAKTRQWWLDHREYEYPPANNEAIARWTALGALRDATDQDTHAAQATIFEVTEVGVELFGELAVNDSNPFRILARAFLEDEREQVLHPLADDDRSQDRATAATLRHARMVAHEVRNALLPVQYALREVWSDPTVASAKLDEQRLHIDDGLARLHRFVDDSLRLTPIASEEAEPFSIMEAVEEARRQCDPPPGGGVLIEAHPGSADPRCRGHRGRFVLALLNLLRNSVQVGGPEVRVEIGVDARTPGRVIVTIRDDGPGISDAQAASVFENGISYRDGGSGHGLSFVRVVIEEEMGGAVRLTSSGDRGGACFELELETEESR
ncbi:MAG: HAMP domain-containing sensor histidine kinase [Nannocystaceae bacterium]